LNGRSLGAKQNGSKRADSRLSGFSENFEKTAVPLTIQKQKLNEPQFFADAPNFTNYEKIVASGTAVFSNFR